MQIDQILTQQQLPRNGSVRFSFPGPSFLLSLTKRGRIHQKMNSWDGWREQFQVGKKNRTWLLLTVCSFRSRSVMQLQCRRHQIPLSQWQCWSTWNLPKVWSLDGCTAIRPSVRFSVASTSILCGRYKKTCQKHLVSLLIPRRNCDVSGFLKRACWKCSDVKTRVGTQRTDYTVFFIHHTCLFGLDKGDVYMFKYTFTIIPYIILYIINIRIYIYILYRKTAVPLTGAVPRAQN